MTSKSSNDNLVLESLVDLSIKQGVEDEKCVVAQYRTTKEQKEIFKKHISNYPRDNIPIEWVIDIADETSGWFYATAYHFDDTKQELHVMVPDKHNPTFDGVVLLDYRTVHLVECIDNTTDALFNRIVRDNVLKVKWDVEWYEEDPNQPLPTDNSITNELAGRWIPSSARYFIRIVNQILVEDLDSEDGTRGYVMLSADKNIKLLRCQKGKGQDEFIRLINEDIVQYTSESYDFAQSYNQSTEAYASPTNASNDIAFMENPLFAKKGASNTNKPVASITNNDIVNESSNDKPDSTVDLSILRKLTDLSRGLKECVNDILDERDNNKKELIDICKLFQSFILNGNIDTGFDLFNKIDKILIDESTNNTSDTINSNTPNYNKIAEETWYISKKLERGLLKLLKDSNNYNKNNEVDKLLNIQNNLQLEITKRDEEIKLLKSKLR